MTAEHNIANVVYYHIEESNGIAEFDSLMEHFESLTHVHSLPICRAIARLCLYISDNFDFEIYRKMGGNDRLDYILELVKSHSIQENGIIANRASHATRK